MKKIFSVILATVLLLTGCSSNNDSANDDSSFVLPDEFQGYVDKGVITSKEAENLYNYMQELISEMSEKGEMPGQLPDGQKPEGNIGEGQLPPEGSIGEGQFPEGPMPEGGMGEGQQQGENIADPLVGAVEKGIITQDQADQLDIMVLSQAFFSQSNMQQGNNQQGNMSTKSTYTVDEANAIEKKLIDAVGYEAKEGGYPIVDTNQTTFFSNDAIIDEPSKGDAFYGQDAQYVNNAQSYTDNGDGTVTDNVTGLMWEQDPGEKLTWPEAVEKLDELNKSNYLGYSDWRIPTMKELYSLVDFSGHTGMGSSASKPYINTDYFKFEYGDAAGEHRFIDSQILTSTIYNSTTLGGNTTVFGYNFADGRIKGYEIDKDFYCYYVRGNTSYGLNIFVDNEDETITDKATGLMWTQYDSGYYKAGDISDGTMNWEDALEWVQQMNDENFLGYSDWRLPDIKELQSLADYSKSPIVTGTPAIDDLFYCTKIKNFLGEDDYGYYWSGTTHDDLSAASTQYGAASYMVFGNALGVMNGKSVDAHGAGSQKSDPKTGDRANYPASDSHAPQGDEQRVFNMVRLVRNCD